MNPELIEKLKKLLRLGRDSGASAHEAATAMAKALKLAADAGIDLSQLPADEDGTLHMTHVTEQSARSKSQRLASALVKRHFGVDTLLGWDGKGKGIIHFIGMESNCELARYCFIYLTRAMRTAWRKRDNRRLRDRDAFLFGYARAIDTLMPETFHQPGLILSAEKYILTFLAPEGTRQMASSKRGRSELAARHGFEAGLRDGIRNGIRGTDKPLIS